MGSGPVEQLPAEPSSDGAASTESFELGVGENGSGPDRRRRRRLAVLGALLLVVIAVVLVLVLATGSGKHTSRGGVPAGETTTTVSVRTLSESATVDGTLGYGGTLELYDRLSGTFTSLPQVGATIARGGTLFKVDNRPVVLMYGSVPAYRTLKEGVSEGPDVVELNDNLIDLGYSDGAITDTAVYSEATADAVRRFQAAEGLPETGEIVLGRVDFAPGARRVTAVHVTLGQDPKGSPAGEGATDKSPGGSDTGSKSPGGSDTGSKSPSASKRPSSTSPSKTAGEKESAAAEEEGAGAGAEAVLTTTSTSQLVAMKLKPEQQGLVHIGQRVPVTLPGSTIVNGHVVAIGAVASESSKGGSEGSSESGEASVPVTVALDRTVAHLDQAPVSVELVKSVHSNVLAVPATALTALAGGGYAITVLEAGQSRQLPVSPGIFADGYVQVEGPGVREGLTVLESE